MEIDGNVFPLNHYCTFRSRKGYVLEIIRKFNRIFKTGRPQLQNNPRLEQEYINRANICYSSLALAHYISSTLAQAIEEE